MLERGGNPAVQVFAGACTARGYGATGRAQTTPVFARRHGHVAASWTLPADLDDPAGEIDVGPRQRERLRDPSADADEELRERPVVRRARSVHSGPGLAVWIRLLLVRQPYRAATISSIAVTADMSPTMQLRMTATATQESMSAYAALPLEPTIPNVDPGRAWAPRRAGL